MTTTATSAAAARREIDDAVAWARDVPTWADDGPTRRAGRVILALHERVRALEEAEELCAPMHAADFAALQEAERARNVSELKMAAAVELLAPVLGAGRTLLHHVRVHPGVPWYERPGASEAYEAALDVGKHDERIREAH